MEISIIRRKNLRALLKIEHASSVNDMIEKTGKSQSILSQWLNKKKIGDKAARDFEEIYNKPLGWMDNQHEIANLLPESGHISELKSDYVVVPSSMQAVTERSIDVGVMISASMGEGIEQPDTETIVDHMRLSTRWLRDNISFSAPANLAVITGYGDSMTPTFSDGDILLVDRGVDKLNIDAIYVLEFKKELFIKRIQRKPDGTFIMRSDNQFYEPYHFNVQDLNELNVLGRVLFAWNGRKL